MEVNNNDLHSYVLTFDNVMPEKILKAFTKYCKQLSYEDASIVNSDGKQLVDKNTRKTSTHAMFETHSLSLTDVHWSNFLHYVFTFFINDYFEMTRLPGGGVNVNDIQILKYGVGGHYTFHTDSSKNTHRTVSCVFFINDDYEGGNLLFRYPFKKEIVAIEKKSNRLIIFPSNMLYAHSVEPVTSGERLSVVSWAL